MCPSLINPIENTVSFIGFDGFGWPPPEALPSTGSVPSETGHKTPPVKLLLNSMTNTKRILNRPPPPPPPPPHITTHLPAVDDGLSALNNNRPIRNASPYFQWGWREGEGRGEEAQGGGRRRRERTRNYQKQKE